ncbi:meiosis protein SPO22/ZIP4 like-domain-containing protein [Amylocarpus encephaloides]|uniref:Meiosis protein SPO22/ZIP4 like-domain-containing protein n=1 Tax=Amylocarpus encephaloides TaxID=45428 RepID=A0A9P7YF14_9HELO|nr:meiosis protein SPO22/ZIP4 like-domain-containing protein [Amylocarpus encephaloides]
MEQNGGSNGHDTMPEASSAASATATSKNAKKRRKVNHACVYCRRSERPCARCIKRNIGHLCHDEPREPESATKKSKKQQSISAAEDDDATVEHLQSNAKGGMSSAVEPSQNQSQDSLTIGTTALPQGGSLQLAQPLPVSGLQANALNASGNQFIGYSNNDWLGTPSQFQDMHNYHPSYMFNAPEVTNEYNLLNDFLNNSLLDDGALLPEEPSGFFNDQPAMMSGGVSNAAGPQQTASLGITANAQGSGISRPASVIPADKARDYYLQAADPSGNDAPEERMQRLLRAKYDAGMLKPFNYVKGYARLSIYMDGHMHATSKQKILRQLERFRPKFREKVQALTDIELIYVEMWFERSLMEYDRGKIALHEILAEESLVNYWEKFGAIAFDQTQKALLTSCSLKNPDDQSKDPTIKCCFSFTIRRDDHKISSDFLLGEGEIPRRVECALSGLEVVSERYIELSLVGRDHALQQGKWRRCRQAVLIKRSVSKFFYASYRFRAEMTSKLRAAISSRSSGTLLHEIERAIASIPNSLGTATASRTEEIDTAATVLWNHCTRLRRDNDSETPQEVPIILDKARVFAFLLLCRAHDLGNFTGQNALRLMKIGFKAAKCCLDREDVELAAKVLERLGQLEHSLKEKLLELSAEHAGKIQRLSSEYFVLRASLAWHQEQFDIVEHMYKNAQSTQRTFDPVTAENLADVLFEMGNKFLATQDYPMAVKWLDRSLEVLSGQELERLSMDASELRITIIQSAVKARLQLKQEDALTQAQNHINILQNELGDKLIVLLLRLEILEASPAESFDTASYFEILERIIRSVVLSEPNVKLILACIRKLNSKESLLACKSLDHFFTMRIIPDRVENLVEKVLITRLWMAIGQEDKLETLISLEEFLGLATENFEAAVTSAATLAAHTLLWKRIESNYSQTRYTLAEKWCQVALHRVFQSSGDVNKARIYRKLLTCALARQDQNSAIEAFTMMPETAKNEPMTRFLMYKIAIRFQLVELAAESLQLISSASTNDPALLYSCCLYSMNGKDQIQTLAALQLVLEKFNYSPPLPVHLPSLLRVTIGITSRLVSDQDAHSLTEETEVLINKLCKIFEGAVNATRKSGKPSGPELWTTFELDWFSKNSYNTAIKHITIWPPIYPVRMLKCCIAFIDQYPRDMPIPVSEDLSLRKMFCEFCAGSAVTVLARGEDNIEVQMQHYLELRKHVASFDRLLEDKLGKMEERQSEDLMHKLATLLAFDFEAACHLKAWDDLATSISKASACRNMHTYQLMADCLLSLQVPTPILIRTLKQIINMASELDMAIISLAKYTRCLFQIALANSPEVAESLLEQVASNSKEASGTDHPYPSEELDWMATRAFNHAVDLYCLDQDDACRNWASKALNIAHFCNDNGALEAFLRERFAVLRLR